MAITYFTGFGSGDHIEAAGFGNIVMGTIQSTIVRPGADFAFRAAPVGNAATYWTSLRPTADGSQGNYFADTGYVTVHVYVVSLPAANSAPIFRVGASFAPTIECRLDTDGALKLHNGTTESASAGTLSTGTWYRLNLKYVKNGTCELGIDTNEAVTNTTATVTHTASNNTPQGITCGMDGAVGHTYDVVFADICVNDSAYPGCGRTIRLDPDGNGTYTAWSGDYTDVDEVPNDEDGTSIASSTDGEAESVTLESCASAGIVGNPIAVKAYVGVRRSGAATTFQMRFRSGATEDDLALVTPTIGYRAHQKIYAVDPADGLAWTPTKIDGIEVGVRKGFHSGAEIRATAMFAMVWEDGIFAAPVSNYAYAFIT